MANTGRIVRTKQEKEFSVIPNSILRDKSMSAKAKGLLCYLLSLPIDWVVHKMELHDNFTDGRASIDTAFRELEKKGYMLRVEIRNDKGQLKGYDYIVYDKAVPISENLKSVKEGEPISGKPISGNQHLQKTDSTKTDITKDIYIHPLNSWIKEKCPNVLKLKTQMISEECEKIVEMYGNERVAEVLLSMDNHKPLTKKYVSVYRTCVNWCKTG